MVSLRSFLIVTDHVSQPYSTTGNVIVLYILIFTFIEKSRDFKSIEELLFYILLSLSLEEETRVFQSRVKCKQFTVI